MPLRAAAKPPGAEALRSRVGLTARDLRNQLTVDIRQPHIAAIEIVGKAFVVQPDLVQQGCVEIENADRLFHYAIPEIIALPDNLAARYPRAGHPETESVRVVIAPDAPLRNRHPAELGM